MKLLVLTQKVDMNDPVLGFFHGWLLEFAKHCEQVIVICLSKGEYDLPKNVKILSLGKKDFPLPTFYFQLFQKIKYALNFWKHIWRERNNYDAVFVHMNPEYVILGALPWKLFGKKIALWYTHKSVDLKLRLAEKFADVIFTASRESFRLKSNKVIVTGHGIDTLEFWPTKEKRKNGLKIITIGRISPTKDYETLIDAVQTVSRQISGVSLDIVGDVGTPEQRNYLLRLKKSVNEKGLDSIIKFVGPIPHNKIFSVLQQADLFINLSHTGSLDKAVLEAMSCGTPVLTSNEAFSGMIAKYGLIFEKKNTHDLANKIEGVFSGKIKIEPQTLRQIVVENHNLSSLIKNIISSMKTT